MHSKPKTKTEMEKFTVPGLSKYTFADGKVLSAKDGKEVKTSKSKLGTSANLYKDDGKRGIVFIDKFFEDKPKAKAKKEEKLAKEKKAPKEAKTEVEIDKAKVTPILRETSSKSDKIRKLGELGLSCSQIGSLMGIKPQFAYNVLFWHPKVKAEKK